MKINKLSLMPSCVLDKEEVFTGDTFTLIFFKTICNKDYSICYSSDDGYFALHCNNKYSVPMGRRKTLALVKKHRSLIQRVRLEASYLGIDGRSLWVKLKLDDALQGLMPAFVILFLLSLITIIFAPLSTILAWLLPFYILLR